MAVKNFGDAASTNKAGWFVGREKESQIFRRLLRKKGNRPTILNVYGLGGIGKSFFLDECRRITYDEGSVFYTIDSRDLAHTPQAFVSLLAYLLRIPADRHTHLETLRRCLAYLTQISQRKKVVLAIDTYEEMHTLDRWLREVLVAQLPANVMLVISGRTPLLDLWRLHPHWRELVVPLPLKPFSFQEVQQFARSHGMEDTKSQAELFKLTEGHPLTLALILETRTKEKTGFPLSSYLKKSRGELAYRWLREIKSEKVRRMVEAAAVVKRFEQDLLEYLIEDAIAPAEFRQLVDLSFIRTTKSGWVVHQLLQQILAKEIRLRTPQQFSQLLQRSVYYYYKRLLGAQTAGQRSALMEDLFFVLADPLLRTVFFDESASDKFFGEPADASNLDEIEKYLDDLILRFQSLHVRVEFTEAVRERKHVLEMSEKYFRREAELLREEGLMSLNPDAFHIIRHDFGGMAGLIVNVPINDANWNYLTESSVSKGFFAQLPPAEKARYAVPAPDQSGCFLRLISFQDDDDKGARRALMRYLLSLWFREPLSVVTTGIPVYIEILESLGFKKVPGATHYCYGEDLAAPTFVLNLQGENLRTFLDGVISRAGISLSPVLAGAQMDLTPREQEVAQLVIESLSNMEIAQRLNITEITVKKHLSSIYEKAGVKNRFELLRKIFTTL